MRFSVIIPTYQRRDVVLKSVCSLSQHVFSDSFEVIVVVDGSRDGTSEALRALNTPFPLRILEQPNRGAATARNTGADAARGEILLFLDDDMVSDPMLLVEHDHSHQQGADVVLGHVPLHPDTPPSILTPGVRDWADHRVQRLALPEAKLTLHDLLTGQISIDREIFKRVGGFDTNFTWGGSFGNEDVDFGYRLLRNGYRIVFNPKAISWQFYVVQPRQYLRQWFQAGSADVIFARKHPEQSKTLFSLNGSEEWTNRKIWRRVVRWPVIGSYIISLLRFLVLSLVERGVQHHDVTQLFLQVMKAVYWQGVHDAGGIPSPHPLRILAYHAIADLSDSPRLQPYGIPPSVFRHQIDSLLRSGFHFITAEEAISYFHKEGGLPDRPVLLTFDDCYKELLDVVLPILVERRIPAVAFAVSDHLGGTNQWDRPIGGGNQRLLDADELMKLAQAGIEIGAHSRTHQPLKHLSPYDLRNEIEGSIAELEKLGLPRPRLFAYPYGEYDEQTLCAIRETDLKAAFTIDPALIRPGQNPFLIPRIEILQSDTGLKFWRKVVLAGSFNGILV